jgi:large subunit ribosomal protein L9e
MKLLVSNGVVAVPAGVDIEVKARAVRVKGPRGVLQRDFKHLAVDMYLVEEEGEKRLKVECHFGKKKRLAAIRTACSHVQNLITGVTKGFEYKMRLVYAHFPININIEDKGAKVSNLRAQLQPPLLLLLPPQRHVKQPGWSQPMKGGTATFELD